MCLIQMVGKIAVEMHTGGWTGGPNLRLSPGEPCAVCKNVPNIRPTGDTRLRLASLISCPIKERKEGDGRKQAHEKAVWEMSHVECLDNAEG